MTPKERAAMQQALEALEMYNEHGAILRPLETTNALREALAEQTIETAERCKWCLAYNGHLDFCPALAEQAEQEPVVKYYGEKLVKGSKVFALLDRDLAPDTPLYAAPVRTKDLTDDEIAQAVGSPLDEVYLADFRAVIAADREKNRG